MSLSIELTFRWPMGHRILGLEGPGAKCRNIHGHNFQAEISLANDDGQLEFGEVKAKVGGWIEDNWDHGFMVGSDDPFAEYLESEGLKRWMIAGQPTTEGIAANLAVAVTDLLGIEPLSVYVREGFNNAATWVQDEPDSDE